MADDADYIVFSSSTMQNNLQMQLNCFGMVVMYSYPLNFPG